MKKGRKLLFILSFIICLGILISCKEETTLEPPIEPTVEIVDYVEETKLNINVTESHQFFGSDGVSLATLVRCVDGDTAIFIANGQEFTARFLGVDTPESTGQVEEWGKTASLFTAGKLNTAVSIVVQTNGGAAQKDTTGTRYLTYVWYQPEANAEYRLLNLELVQEGLSYGKSSTASLYASQLIAAQNQAMHQKLRMFGDKKDENYYYGDAQAVTIKHILEHQEEMIKEVTKVSFDCTITREDGLYVYAQDYDAETNEVYSLLLYKGYNLSTKKLVLGNRVKITGNVQEYGGLVQISNMQDIAVASDDNIKLLEKNYEIKVTTISAEDLLNASSSKERLLVKLENVKVVSMYTTKEGDSAGAITITGEVDGKTVKIRTSVLRKENYELITESYFENKTITVVGLLETYENSKQVKVVSIDDVTFEE
ncbi:MAG: thermonuclease family protein [Roseburia sp.]|nr:thermonuclease family protein [Anaeroplasma bactoclasticum]MCM1196227.1 thermonuclease family protein [Roseburia sp.]MCM1556049.1 thermonuclease family protein [Anaeroplasma bactoclasticum]